MVPDDLYVRVLRAREHVRDSYDEPLTLARLARTAHLSPFHFLRVYSAAFGVTPGQDLSRVRLERSRDLLARGASVTEACFAVGFASLGSFSTRFTRAFGVSPRTFRDAARTAAVVPDRLVGICVPFCFAQYFVH